MGVEGDKVDEGKDRKKYARELPSYLKNTISKPLCEMQFVAEFQVGKKKALILKLSAL